MAAQLTAHPPVTFEKPEGDMLRSGGSAPSGSSANSGYFPLALDHLPLGALENIPIHLRTMIKKNGVAFSKFSLYCTSATRFTEYHRARLREAGVRFVYIQMASQTQFRQQVEKCINEVASDPAAAISAKAELIYDTSVELINELLTDPTLADKMGRLETISRAITTLVINDDSAFSHLFAASQHDFYTATHMVNVGTWMVPLAYALGIRDTSQLNEICMAGVLHDIGKIFIPEEVLNKRGPLSDDDWALLRQHPQLGVDHLSKYQHISELILRVTLEHHERMDATGYPRAFNGEQMHLVSRICAVVDSFDAMTAYRPFKTSTKSFAQALQILQNEAPAKYDPAIVDAWIKLMQHAENDGAVSQSLTPEPSPEERLGRRLHERFGIECPARVHRLELQGDSHIEHEGLAVVAHSISHGGLAFMSRTPIEPSQLVRVYLQGNGTLANKQFEGQLVRCRHHRDGWHDIGMKIVSISAEIQSAQAASSPQINDA